MYILNDSWHIVYRVCVADVPQNLMLKQIETVLLFNI